MLTENRVANAPLKRRRLALIKERHRMLFLDVHDEIESEIICDSGEDDAFGEEFNSAAG